MADDIYISIVPDQGSRDSKWSGLFKFDSVNGYSGRLLSPTFDIKGGAGLFEIPKELDQETLYCLIDGSTFGTIIWPHFSGGPQIKNFAARLLRLDIRQLIRGVHVGANERDISAVRLSSPIFAHLFRLNAFESKIETTPEGKSLKLSINNLESQDKSFNFSLGKASVGIFGGFSLGVAPKLSATSYVTLDFENNVNPTEALRIIRRIEHFFSLITFNFIKAERIDLECVIPDGAGKTEKHHYELERARLNENAKTDIEQHKIPIRLEAIDIGAAFDKFQIIFDSIEQTLNWYRIVTVEDRYLEDKYFYCVRMIEGLYRALEISTDGDKEAINVVGEISKVLEREDADKNARFIKFLNERVTNIFSRASLASIIEHMKDEYKDISVVEILDTKKINSLRAKNAHGSAQRFTNKDHQFMYYAYDILLLLYPMIVLERCGFARDFLCSQLAKSFTHRRYFTQETVNEFKKNL
jgi:hypothetical protein